MNSNTSNSVGAAHHAAVHQFNNILKPEWLRVPEAGLYDLWECSPVRFEDSEPHTERIIDALFPGTAKTCAGTVRAGFNRPVPDDCANGQDTMGLRVQNFQMPVSAFEPAPKPPGEFQVFRTSAPPGAAGAAARD